MDSITRHFDRLRRLLRRRGRTVEDTEDLIQEAFLRLQAYDLKHEIREPEAFLVRTVLNLSVDERRQSHRHLFVNERPEELSISDAAPPLDEVIGAQQRLERMILNLRSLSPRTQEVFLLHRLEGYTYTQIARRVGISVSAVEKHVARAALAIGEWMDSE